MSPSRSLTGNHDILPYKHHILSDSKTNIALAKLTGGTVIWRIWPAVLLHTTFAAFIVTLSTYTPIKLVIPNIMLTLLGVVIGFVISLRVSSGYDRYWWGRCAWSDLIRNSRAISRLIWIHVPPRLGKLDNLGVAHLHSGSSSDEIRQVMKEKRVMMELIEAFAVSMKHYVRGELGIYYEDLYYVARPFHEHRHHVSGKKPSNVPTHPSEGKFSEPNLSTLSPETALLSGSSTIPPVNSYGSTKPTPSNFQSKKTLKHFSSSVSLASSDSSIHEHLLPANLLAPDSSPSADLIPFSSYFIQIGRYINPHEWYIALIARWQRNKGDEESGSANRNIHVSGRRAARQIHRTKGKHRPRVAGDGENLPLEIIRCMSEWVCLLESRGIVSGSTIGGLYGCIAAYEEVLGTLERILTTPLPYVYSRHIRHTVWLYLFFLPFQLAEDFGWYTVPGVAVAAFFYLGFLAAGDEIEQPFGYDENDLDLDLFCREIVKADLRMLVTTAFPNAPIGSQHAESEINETRTVVELCV